MVKKLLLDTHWRDGFLVLTKDWIATKINECLGEGDIYAALAELADAHV